MALALIFSSNLSVIWPQGDSKNFSRNSSKEKLESDFTYCGSPKNGWITKQENEKNPEYDIIYTFTSIFDAFKFIISKGICIWWQEQDSTDQKTEE